MWLAVALVVALVWRWQSGALFGKDFELDQAEIGIGHNKVRFKPNLTARQTAYAIWVELSTRKIGLPIDFDHDVIAEVYDSWYSFFSVTRDLIKSIPISQAKTQGTQDIIKLSIEVLNEGLRPHLTQWQARFRHWYEAELRRAAEEKVVIDPQGIQQSFPKYAELKADMEKINRALMIYREKMQELVFRQ